MRDITLRMELHSHKWCLFILLKACIQNRNWVQLFLCKCDDLGTGVPSFGVMTRFCDLQF